VGTKHAVDLHEAWFGPQASSCAIVTRRFGLLMRTRYSVGVGGGAASIVKICAVAASRTSGTLASAGARSVGVGSTGGFAGGRRSPHPARIETRTSARIDMAL
jgi:hypothetical protein